MTDAELRELLRQSPEQGYRALFDTYFNYVYAVVQHVLQNSGSREDVEECVMDVFMEVIQHCDTEHEGTLKAFIGTTARHRAIDWRRSVSSRNRHVTSLEEEQLSVIHSDQNVEQSVECAEQSRILMDCIQTLGEPDATILIQKFFYERNSSEIGRIVGLAPTAVRMRCSRAVKRLKTELVKRNIIL